MSNVLDNRQYVEHQRICVLGGGAWGTALAAMSANLGHEVRLFARDAKTVEELNHTHQNSRYLPNIDLPAAIVATTDAEYALKKADVVLAVLPAQVFGSVLSVIAHYIPKEAPLVLCAKGIERTSGRFMSEVAKQQLPNQPIAALSGPSFACDVARGLPTAVTIAADNSALAHHLAQMFSGPVFRCYASTDVIGVEIGGSLKNVLALAAGAATGRGLGASAQAALVTRGFSELRRIGTAYNARPQTMMGLAVLGDLMLTCSSPQSRNYSYGLALGSGRPTDQLPLAEGVATAPVAARLCDEKRIEAPIIHAIAALLEGQLTIDNAVNTLISRPLKFED